jgi:hypothetical protein
METRNCQNCKTDFNIQKEDFDFYAKLSVPAPTFCPDCRLQRRIAWRNERGLFYHTNNAEGATGQIISIYPESSNVTVYDHNFWWGDSWNAQDFGKEYDFSRTFFEQFKELLHSVPLVALFDSKGSNTRFCNTVTEHKNCYMVTAGWTNEDSLYSNRISFCKETVDCYTSHKLDFGYENVYCGESHNLFFSEQSHSCVDSWFVFDCRNSTNCILSSGLRNKSYCIENIQYTKESYKEKLAELVLDTRQGIEAAKIRFEEIKKNAIRKYANLVNCQNVVGDNIENARNVYYSFDLPGGLENVKYCNWGTFGLKDSYDTGPGTGGKSELTYDGISCGVQNSRCLFGAILWNSHDVAYAFNCYGISNSFGCVSMRSSSYCILNKQYTKEEYEELLPKVIAHMNEMPYIDAKGNSYKYGEFFPIEISPFPYNATVAQDFMPVTKDEAIKANYSWEDKLDRSYNPTILSKDIPDSIDSVEDSITSAVLECVNAQGERSFCSKAFRIITEELIFYRRFKLPLPNACPNCRHYERTLKRNPMKLWHRKCMNEGCQNEFETSYSPDRSEIVYCESCYQKEVI